MQSNMKIRGFDVQVVVMLMSMLSLVYCQNKEVVTTTNIDGGRIGSHSYAFYVLGDSSVDCGDNTLFYPLLHGHFSLYPCNGSDSTLLPQLLAEKIGLKSMRPFYGQNGSVEEIFGGLNFGSTQATIMNQGSQSHQSLNQQLRQVSETMQLLQLHLATDIALQFTRSSIFALSFGKDDYIDLFLQNSTNQMSNHTFATILVDQMTNAVRYLYDANARKIICFGILPLGCTPRVAWEMNRTSDYNGSGCEEQVNDLIMEYNNLLEEHMAKLNTELPEIHVVFCDVYHGMMEIINQPWLFGFVDTKTACCGLGLNGAMIGCMSMDIACNEPSKHLWWDLLNPTQAVNSILADAAWSGSLISNLCHPITIRELFNIKV
ncbi:hypothetical protein HN51_049669 [Arachis hypogaea]|nr:GDSL esterase/lipase At1g71250 isoform X1 [Arachis ipaensis]XP_025664324.1 GDSL esterase/lipase At1g71250 [Arachis hypogaea]QHN91262.1 GDSL esterase/lipase [Arachis hypogaea]